MRGRTSSQRTPALLPGWKSFTTGPYIKMTALTSTQLWFAKPARSGLIDHLSAEQVAQLADIMDAARNHLRTVSLMLPRKRKLR